jgi:hypothetical protein
VEEYRAQYRPVHHQFKILFILTTSVSKIHEINHSIPQYGFELADYETIMSRYNDHTYLTGIDPYFTFITKFSLKISP